MPDMPDMPDMPGMPAVSAMPAMPAMPAMSAIPTMSALPALHKSRSKACKSCIAAKRKCGREFPVCSRCTNRGLECVYDNPPIAMIASQTGAGVHKASATKPRGTTSSEELFAESTLYDLDAINIDLVARDFFYPSPSPGRVSSLTSSSTTSSSAASSAMSWASSFTMSSSKEPSFILPLLEICAASEKNELKTAEVPPYIKIQKCVSRNGVMVSEERGRLVGILGDGIGHAMNSREISFAMNWFRQFPVAFSKYLTCAVIPPNLYNDLPPVLSSALAICSLAEKRESMDHDTAKRVEATLEYLIVEHFGRFNYEDSLEFVDKLAFIQAASLLQAIALYSNNVSLCGVGETNMAYVMSLYEDALIFIQDNQSRQTENWNDWKLVQNAQIAVFMGFISQNLYLLMKKSTGFVYSFNGKWMSFCPYREVWEARNEHEWREAMFSKPHRGHLLLCNTANVILDPATCEQMLPDSLIVMGLLFGFEQVERCLKIRNFTDFVHSRSE